MSQFNGYTVIKRYDRPSPNSIAFLEFLFLKDGILQDPYQVCSVHIFPDTQKGSADAYLDLSANSPNYGTIVASAASSYADFIFTNTDSLGARSASPADADDEIYFMGQDAPYTASSIFKIRNGHYAVALTPQSSYYNWDTQTRHGNSASAIGRYLDLWTVVDVAGSEPQVYTNKFEFFTNGAFALTEIPHVTTTERLINKYINVGSNERIRIALEYATENRRTDRELLNLLQDSSLITSPALKITKLNESPDMTSRVIIYDFADTEDLVDISADNIVSYQWDTSYIVAKDGEDILGGTRGVYEVQLRYEIFGEVRYSDRFTLVVH